jgi:hypothetical protein
LQKEAISFKRMSCGTANWIEAERRIKKMFKFRKIASVLASTAMLTSTVALAAAANFPAPFVSGGSADVALVWGSTAANTDLAAVVEITSKLSDYVVSGSAAGDGGATVSGGDSVSLATSSRKLYYGDNINAARTSMTYTELGEVLADETFTDLGGTAYDYTQTVVPGPAPITYGTSGGDLDDPVLYIDAGTTAGTLYNYTLSLNKNLNVSDSSNVQGQKIKILGVDYVIGTGSTNSTLYLYGSGETVTIAGGEESTVNIAGTDHTIALVTTSSATAGTIKVDGISKSVIEGRSYAFAGDINVYIKDIIHPAYAGDLRQAELIIGANTLKLANGATVKQGADETSIKGTNVIVTAADFGKISGFTVQIAPAKSDVDSIAVGESFTDSVFGGLKIDFGAVVPALDSASRSSVVVNTDNNQFGYVTFTSARAGSAGEQKLAYVYDNSTASTTIAPLLAHQTISSNEKGHIHVLEGESAKESDWIVINQGDAGTILEVDDISIDTATSGSVTLSDVITGDSQKITLTNSTGTYDKSGVSMFGGNNYFISADSPGTAVNITWNTAGTVAVYPRVKLASGGWIAFLKEQSITIPAANTTNVIFPNGLTTLSTTGSAITNETTGVAGNGINWTVSVAGQVATIKTIDNTATACSFNSSYGPAVLVIEPKKWDDASYGNHICIPLTTAGTTEISIGDPKFNGTNSGFVTFTSDTYKKQAVDKFGTLVTKEDRTNENGKVTIAMPESQMYFDVFFTSEDAVVAGGTSSGGVRNTNIVAVKDSEVSSASGKNLIVVGGSCVNTVAAQLLGVPSPACGSAFTSATGVSSGFLIQTFDGLSSGTVATLVAGYNAVDTTNAAKALTTQTVDTTVGKKYTGQTASSITPVVA